EAGESGRHSGELIGTILRQATRCRQQQAVCGYHHSVSRAGNPVHEVSDQPTEGSRLTVRLTITSLATTRLAVTLLHTCLGAVTRLHGYSLRFVLANSLSLSHPILGKWFHSVVRTRRAVVIAIHECVSTLGVTTLEVHHPCSCGVRRPRDRTLSRASGCRVRETGRRAGRVRTRRSRHEILVRHPLRQSRTGLFFLPGLPQPSRGTPSGIGHTAPLLCHSPFL